MSVRVKYLILMIMLTIIYVATGHFNSVSDQKTVKVIKGEVGYTLKTL